MKHKRILLLPLCALTLLSCQPKAASNQEGSVPSEKPDTTDTSKPEDPTAAPSDEPAFTPLTISKYVPSVKETAPYMLSGMDSGTKVDYVVSSYPVIQAALLNKNRKTSLSVYENVTEKFSKKYQTDGFPQAGLFIKTSLSEDKTKESAVKSFLKTFDEDIKDLASGAIKTVEKMNAYAKDSKKQQSRFGFASPILQASQKTNALSFLPLAKNPDVSGFKKFESPLGLKVSESDLSSYYGKDYAESEEASSLAFSVVTPQGAPSACFARYASDSEHFVTSQPTGVLAELNKGEKDFIIFDSVNGMKLAKKNKGNYKLVRMVTFGNLYLMATGNDEDKKPSLDDYIVSYGENLLPDLVFKAVYSKE